MSYRQGESVIDHSYCEEDILRSAKSNIRHFIEVIIGLVLGIALLGVLGSTLIGSVSCLGSCLGCKECVETAMCADDCLSEVGCTECGAEEGCWEEIALENLQNANDCVSCDGIDCFGREGCFACNGVGDCSNCDGTKYYSFTIDVYGETYSHRIEESQKYLEIYYPSNQDSSYCRFLGYFNKAEGGTQYVNEEGRIIKTLKDGMTLYGHYEERNAGQTYYFELDLEVFGQQNKTLALTVGGVLAGLPEAPVREGYDFDGWYLGNRKVHSGVMQSGEIFRLSAFGIHPDDSRRNFTLVPKYTAREYTVTFIYNGSRYEFDANYTTTFGSLFDQFNYWHINMNNIDSFFGWGLAQDSDPEERVTEDMTVERNTTLYPILRNAVWYTFYYNINDYDYNYISVKFREGQTDIYLSEVPELALFKEDSANPGYKFLGWFSSREGDYDDQATDHIPLVPTNSFESQRTFYARWAWAEYEIEYYVKDYVTGETNVEFRESYEYSLNAVYELITAAEVPHNYGYTFKGWCETENCVDTPKTYLPTGTYGAKKLYAKFESKTYNASLIPAMAGATINGSTAVKTQAIVYGVRNELPVAYKEGYEFLGWYYDNNGTDVQVTKGDGVIEKFTFETLGQTINTTTETKFDSEGFRLIAKWDIQKFTVTFRVDGKLHAEKEVEWGKYLQDIPETPEKAGHDFKYWKDSSGYEFKFNQNAITSDVTLEAHFEIQKFVVLFYDSDKTTLLKSYSAVEWGTELSTKSSSIKLTDDHADETRARRKIVGWKDFETDETVETTTTVKGTMKLYADVESSRTFTFLHYSNGQFTKYTDRHYYNGEVYDFPSAPSKNGYTFKGWCTDEDLTSEPVLSAVRIKTTSKQQYYAKYEANTYTLTYYADGSLFTPTDSSYSKYTIEDVNKELPTGSDAPKKTGYTFKGWCLISSLTDTPKDTLDKGAWGDKSLYAKFEANTYEITCNDTEYPVTFDQNFTLPGKSAVEVREGYTFHGWSWSEGGQLVTDENGASLAPYTYDEGRTAYPVYKPTEYTMTWKGNVTNNYTWNVLSTTTIRHFDTSIEQIENPTKTGYRFVGWYTSTALTQEFDFSQEVTGNMTAYAKFVIEEYTVTFSIGGSIRDELTVSLEYQSSLESAINAAQAVAGEYATEKNAKFKHWISADGSQYTASSIVPAGNLALKAIFDMPVYVTFEVAPGVFDETRACVKYNGESLYLHKPSRTGYTFNAWYRGNQRYAGNNYITIEGSNDSATEYTFRADWTANSYTIYYYLINEYGSSYLAHTQTYTMDQTEKDGGLTLWTGTGTEGYTLDGWYKDGYQNGQKYEAVDNSESVTMYQNLSFYGKWIPREYTITIKSGGVVQKTLTLKFKDMPSVQTWVAEFAQSNPGKFLMGFYLETNKNKYYLNNDGTWTDNFDPNVWTGDIVLVADWL